MVEGRFVETPSDLFLFALGLLSRRSRVASGSTKQLRLDPSALLKEDGFIVDLEVFQTRGARCLNLMQCSRIVGPGMETCMKIVRHAAARFSQLENLKQSRKSKSREFQILCTVVNEGVRAS